MKNRAPQGNGVFRVAQVCLSVPLNFPFVTARSVKVQTSPGDARRAFHTREPAVPPMHRLSRCPANTGLRRCCGADRSHPILRVFVSRGPPDRACRTLFDARRLSSGRTVTPASDTDNYLSQLNSLWRLLKRCLRIARISPERHVPYRAASPSRPCDAV